MKKTTKTHKGNRQRFDEKNNNRKAVGQNVSIEDTISPEPHDLKVNYNDEITRSMILRSFDGYTGEIFKVAVDVDSTPYILHPELEIDPHIYSLIRIPMFKDQFGDLQVLFLDDHFDNTVNIWGETMDVFLERSTKEWVVLPYGDYGSVPPEFNLPDPDPFDYCYECIIELCFGDYLIESVDHPVLIRLAKRFGKVA
ncbi:MAG: hypothetical protein KKE62_01655 [Proteobacteria bacterium]|nr:hypothetical protein [Pseudomonadota bacterium]MBU1387157.1 hypothetical protein [Pseudomonadota bacterium]MBU1541526.1 hypothetical protein [Pseudomonadota bacterium]MBU2429258.1 hypothetical protein [Pseudomonadota bacterium]MBU2481831.1 hypothetical protein [Pseudomonadota bacterium]